MQFSGIAEYAIFRNHRGRNNHIYIHISYIRRPLFRGALGCEAFACILYPVSFASLYPSSSYPPHACIFYPLSCMLYSSFGNLLMYSSAPGTMKIPPPERVLRIPAPSENHRNSMPVSGTTFSLKIRPWDEFHALDLPK